MNSLLGLFRIFFLFLFASIFELGESQEGAILLQILNGRRQSFVVVKNINLLRRRRRRYILRPQEVLRHVILRLGRNVGVREVLSRRFLVTID